METGQVFLRGRSQRSHVPLPLFPMHEPGRRGESKGEKWGRQKTGAISPHLLKECRQPRSPVGSGCKDGCARTGNGMLLSSLSIRGSSRRKKRRRCRDGDASGAEMQHSHRVPGDTSVLLKVGNFALLSKLEKAWIRLKSGVFSVSRNCMKTDHHVKLRLVYLFEF